MRGKGIHAITPLEEDKKHDANGSMSTMLSKDCENGIQQHTMPWTPSETEYVA